MKLKNTFKGDQEMNRRECLKKSGQAALAIGAGLTLEEILSSCATTETEDGLVKDASEKPRTVIYPPLKNDKVQPPAEGCYIGFRRVFQNLGSPQAITESIRKAREIVGHIRDIGELRETMIQRRNQQPDLVKSRINNYVEHYQKALGQIPHNLMIMETVWLWYTFPTWEAEILAKKGVTPFLMAQVGSEIPISPYMNLDLREIIKGTYDSYIKDFAEGARQFGEKYGGFFISTMQEMNGFWMPWHSDPKTFKKAWQHIWEKFEEAGANRYATWVWSPDAPDIGAPTNYRLSENPEWYYPGDDYVDWIGWSAYARASIPHQDRSFKALNETICNKMHSNHKGKPLMQTEFGKTDDFRQQSWLRDAFQTIKSWPEMKAAVYWDISDSPLNEDYMLNSRSLEFYKEILKDPYFIMA
jgi:hypothetical protein